MRKLICSAAFPALVILAAHAPVLHAQHAGVDTLEIRAHTRFLADDLLRGRGTGTEGERLAAAYIESQLIRLGLQPAGAGPAFQLPVPLVAARIADGTTLAVTQAGSRRVWHAPQDFIVNTGGAAAFRDFSGTVLFAGSPLEAGPALRDREDLHGVVIAITGLPGAAALELVPDWIRRGAGGVLVLADSAYFDLVARSRGTERLYVDAPVEDPVWQPALPTLVLGAELSEALLDRAAAAHAARPAGHPPTAIAVDWRVEATIRVERRLVPAANVAGVLPGSDPVLQNEYIVYTAHYDHLGVSTPDASGDSIYNGFSDNAAGVAMLLAIAHQLRTSPPGRSVLFLFLTGEERGLLGSTWFATQPPIPLDRVRGVINLDAGAPPAPPTSWRVAAGPRSEPLSDAARAVAEHRGWRLEFGAASPNSDHWPFVARGVPAIFLIPDADWEHTTSEQAALLRDRFERYHQPGDRWHPDFPFAGLRRYAEFALEIGLRL